MIEKIYYAVMTALIVSIIISFVNEKSAKADSISSCTSGCGIAASAYRIANSLERIEQLLREKK